MRGVTRFIGERFRPCAPLSFWRDARIGGAGRRPARSAWSPRAARRCMRYVWSEAVARRLDALGDDRAQSRRGRLAVCLYLGMAAILYFTQRSMMYFPETVHTDAGASRFAGSRGGDAECGRRRAHLAWHVAPRDDRPIVLYFHGNGGALRYRVERFRKLVRDGIGLRRARISRLWRLERHSDRSGPDRRRRGRLRLCRRALSGEADRCFGASCLAPALPSPWQRRNRSGA